MIVLADEGQPFQIARAEAGEGLTGLELEIDLVADETAQLVNLVTVIGGDPDTAVDRAPHRHRFRRSRDGVEQAADGERCRPHLARTAANRDSTVHGATPLQPAV